MKAPCGPRIPFAVDNRTEITIYVQVHYIHIRTAQSNRPEMFTSIIHSNATRNRASSKIEIFEKKRKIVFALLFYYYCRLGNKATDLHRRIDNT